MSAAKRPSAPSISVIVLMALSLLAFAAAACMVELKLRLLQAGVLGKDLGLYASILSQHRFFGAWLPSESLRFAYGEPSFLQEHFAPTLLLLAPLYRWIGEPAFLSALPPLLWALNGSLIFILAQRRQGSLALAAALACLYWLHPLSAAAAFDLPQHFHHDAFFLPFLLAAALAWDRQHSVWALGWAALALGLKPDLALAACFASGLLLIGRSRGRAWSRSVVALFVLALFLVAWQIAYDLWVGPSRHVKAVLQSAWFGNPWQEQLSMLGRWGLLALWPGLLASPLLALAFAAEALLHLMVANVPRVWEWHLALALVALASAWAPPYPKLSQRIGWLAPWSLVLAYLALALALNGPMQWESLSRWRILAESARPLDMEGARVLLDGLGPADTVAVPDAVFVHFAGRASLVWSSLEGRCRYRLLAREAQVASTPDPQWETLHQAGGWELQRRRVGQVSDP